MEAGLFKKEPKTSNGHEHNQWEDAVQAWDNMLEADDDDIPWASDTDGKRTMYKLNGYDANGTSSGRVDHIEENIGPKGESRPYVFPSSPPIPDDNVQRASSTPILPSQGLPVLATPIPPTPVETKTRESSKVDVETYSEEDRDTVPPTLDDLPSAVRTQAIDVPVRSVRSSYSAGSVTSSSDGSPVDKLGTALEATALERERGRNRAQTPIQGNRPPEEWCVHS